jgi:cytochrome c5
LTLTLESDGLAMAAGEISSHDEPERRETVNKLILVVMGMTGLAITGSALAGDGEQIYKSRCMTCHASGVAGAPKLGDKEAWAPRIETGEDAMLATVIKGKGAMPPRGTCMECSEEQLRAAVQYMISQVE